MQDTTLAALLHLPNEAFLFDLDALHACLQTIPDHRDRRGVRYALANLLMIAVLAFPPSRLACVTSAFILKQL
jgi:hypothetical protein